MVYRILANISLCCEATIDMLEAVHMLRFSWKQLSLNETSDCWCRDELEVEGNDIINLTCIESCQEFFSTCLICEGLLMLSLVL
jgi:hypothetical protein